MLPWIVIGVILVTSLIVGSGINHARVREREERLTAQGQAAAEAAAAAELRAEVTKLRSQIVALRDDVSTCQDAVNLYEQAFDTYSAHIGAGNKGDYSRAEYLYDQAVRELESARSARRRCSPLLGLP